MEIRKADSKGRLAVGEDGTYYTRVENADGSITLFPVLLPEPTPADSSTLRAVYWKPGLSATRPDQVFVYSVIRDFGTGTADWIADLANDLKVPVVVDKPHGLAVSRVDYLIRGDKVERGVIIRD